MNVTDRAEWSKQCLDNPAFAEIHAELEKVIFETLVACPERDKDGRDELLKMLKVSRRYKEILQIAIDNGKVEAAKLKKEPTLIERWRQRA